MNRPNNLSNTRGDGGGWRQTEEPSKRFRNGNEDDERGPRRRVEVHHSSGQDDGQKLARRRDERLEKKERLRTLSYFTAVGQAISDAKGDAEQLSSIADGFFSDLAKRLQSDSADDLLRNGTVCRTIEAALTSSGSLLHCKSTMYLLLGKAVIIMTSPTASYVMEALFACVACAAGHLAQEDDSGRLVDKELFGDQGLHAGSGVPSTKSILRALIDEIVDNMDVLLLDACASRCLRTLTLCLAGSPLVLAKLPPSRLPSTMMSGKKPLPHFQDLLLTLAESFVGSVERVFADGRSGDSGGAWLAAATTVAPSGVLQVLLQHVAGDERLFPDIAKLIRHDRIERLLSTSAAPPGSTANRPLEASTPLLTTLMLDPVGSHVFQAYLRSTCGNTSPGDHEPKDKAAAASSPWHRALNEHFLPHVKQLLSGTRRQDDGPLLGKTEGFILQDLVLYAPDEASLQLLWDDIIGPNVTHMLTTPLLSASIVRFSRKCAHGARAEMPSDFPDEANALVAKDMQAGAPYFRVSSGLRSTLVTALTSQLKQLPDGTKKGAAFSLLVGHVVGGELPSYELALNLLLCGRQAAMQFVNSYEKLRAADLCDIARHPQGTYVLQQLARVLAAEPTHHQKGQSLAAKPHGVGGAVVDVSAVGKFQRRLLPNVEVLASNKYSAFLIEALYDLGNSAAKEELVVQLAPLLQKVKEEERAHGRSAATITPDVDAEKAAQESGAGAGRFFLRKVLLKCCVDQYVVNAEQWRAVATRQAHVKKLMHAILATEGI